MAVRLYTNQTPNNPNETDNTYNLGMQVVIARDCYVVGGARYGAVSTPSTVVKQHLWSLGGSQLALATYGAHQAGAWNFCLYASPVLVAAGTAVVTAYGPTNAYVAFLGLHSGALVNGDITAPANGAGGAVNGRYITNAGVDGAFPSESGGGNGYGADILIGDLKTGAVTTLLSGIQVDASGLATAATVEPPAATGGGWETLRGIYGEAAELARQDAERDADPIDCPSCGWPLRTSALGVRYCEQGDYRSTWI